MIGNKGLAIALVWLLIGMIMCSCSRSQQKSDNSVKEEKKDIAQTPKDDKKTILFFGNSLTAGYGLEEEESFTWIIQQKIDSLDLPYRVVNAGLSGETTSGGLNRIDWVLKQPIDVFVLELGGNDALRGLDVNQSKENLKAIIRKVRAKNNDIRIVLAGMQAPPNMGNDYTSAFAEIYPSLAQEFDLALIPFLLKDVGGIAELNLPDRIHPNAKGQIIVARNVWNVLMPILKQ